MSEPAACRLRFTRLRGQQRNYRGATAVEFALVFPIFFMLFYAIVAYGLVMTIQQSLTLAAAEGARAAVQDGTDTERVSRATATAKGVLSWLPGVDEPTATSPAACAANPAARCVTVTVSYNTKGNKSIVPPPLLGISIPATLSATATVQL